MNNIIINKKQITNKKSYYNDHCWYVCVIVEENENFDDTVSNVELYEMHDIINGMQVVLHYEMLMNNVYIGIDKFRLLLLLLNWNFFFNLFNEFYLINI